MLLEQREMKKVEEKTIGKYIENDELNIEKVINEYSGYIYIIVKNLAKETISKEDIEEIISDVFVTFWNNREKLDKTKPIKSYLAGITKNLVKEKRKVINIHADISDYENSIQDKIKIDMIYENREKIKTIENIVKNMKEEDIFIFNLFYYSSMKLKEIATILNITEFNVKTRLYRIRKKIKKELSKGGYSYEE